MNLLVMVLDNGVTAVGSVIEIKDDNVLVGVAATVNFRALVSVSAGVVTVTNVPSFNVTAGTGATCD